MAPGRKKTFDGERKTTKKASKSSNKQPKAPDIGPKAPDKGQRAPDKGQRAPDKGQRAPDKGQRAPDKGLRAPDKGLRALTLDRFDAAILRVLQGDGRISNRDLAERVGLSAAPCWRRVKRLEDEGYIEKYVAVVNPKKLGMQVLAIAEICLDNHHSDTLEAFGQAVRESDEILECHSVSGQCDYLLKIMAQDMERYEHFLSKTLLQVHGIRSVNTMFSLKQPKLILDVPL